MKRFLSWIVLILCIVAIALYTTLMVIIGKFLLGVVDGAGLIGKIVAVFFGGSVLIGMFYFLISTAVYLTVKFSDAVRESLRGTRYIVAGILVILLSVFEMITAFRPTDVLMLIYAAALVIVGFSKRKEKIS